MSVRSLKNVSALVVALVAVWPAGHPAVARPCHRRQQLLIEEAYNQERGVVQHISACSATCGPRAWAYMFTQEWPLATQTHQLSYTIPIQRTARPSSTGLGDAALNYRYQLHADARVAIAPRLSMIVPTGSAARGLGSGHVGAQLNVPVSVMLGPTLVSHWNAGVTAVSRGTTYNLGASMIWLLDPVFNVMCETRVDGSDGWTHDIVVNPGIRWAHNFASGLQIVRCRVSAGQGGAFVPEF